MTKRTIADIAADMRAQVARADGAACQRLNGGLELILARRDDQLMLTLRRMDIPPSEVEVIIMRSAFAVPDEPQVQPFAKKVLSPKTGEQATYRGVTLTWREIAPQ